MTNPYSKQITDPNHMFYYFNFFGNITFNKHHSIYFYERGFVVDNKSDNGMSVRDTGKSELSGSVYNRQMVQNLSSSQKYIEYTWLLTFTANSSIFYSKKTHTPLQL